VLTIHNQQRLTETRMPGIVNLGCCSDMGRINGALPWAAATFYSLAATPEPIASQLCTRCDLAGIVDPWAYLRDVLDKLSRDWPQSRIDELLPRQWKAARTQ